MVAVAYTLQLPSQSKIHNVFHVSQLKRHVGDTVTAISIPETEVQIREPELILDHMTVKRKKQSCD